MNAWLKVIAPVAVAVVTALTPFYGKDVWFVALVAAASALGLAAPTILPKRASAGASAQNQVSDPAQD